LTVLVAAVAICLVSVIAVFVFGRLVFAVSTRVDIGTDRVVEVSDRVVGFDTDIVGLDGTVAVAAFHV